MPATQHRRTFDLISYGSGIRRRNVGIGVVMASAILGRLAAPDLAGAGEWFADRCQVDDRQQLCAAARWEHQFVDGRPLFGASKTVRGILVSILITSACAPLLGLGLRIGLLVAISAMAGDLLSSFLKRRLDLQPGSQALGLDQIPNRCFRCSLARRRSR